MAGTPRTFEYRTVPAGEADLAALGRDGWELAGVGSTGTLYFKRPAPNFRERITLDQRRALERSHPAPADEPGR